jgi:hypothetical protein
VARSGFGEPLGADVIASGDPVSMRGPVPVAPARPPVPGAAAERRVSDVGLEALWVLLYVVPTLGWVAELVEVLAKVPPYDKVIATQSEKLLAFEVVGLYVLLAMVLGVWLRARRAVRGRFGTGVVEQVRGWSFLSFVSLSFARHSARVRLRLPTGRERAWWLTVDPGVRPGDQLAVVLPAWYARRPLAAASPREAWRRMLWSMIGGSWCVILLDLLALVFLALR